MSNIIAALGFSEAEDLEADSAEAEAEEAESVEVELSSTSEFVPSLGISVIGSTDSSDGSGDSSEDEEDELLEEASVYSEEVYL
ncbi:MAG: hypothetical protein HRT88_13230 [Lentisphaeraceae bacterium]|nr:hypothetical protein [Lentisphaeraceae bacterium]